MVLFYFRALLILALLIGFALYRYDLASDFARFFRILYSGGGELGIDSIVSVLLGTIKVVLNRLRLTVDICYYVALLRYISRSPSPVLVLTGLEV